MQPGFNIILPKNKGHFQWPPVWMAFFFGMSGMVIVWRGASPRTRRVERKR